GDDMQFFESPVIAWPQMLDVLDSEAAVSRAILFSHFGESVEHHSVRLIADGVNRDRKPRLIGRANHHPHRVRLGDVDACVFRLSEVWLEHLCRAGTQRAVHKALYTADTNIVVAVIRFRPDCNHFLAQRDWPAQVETNSHLSVSSKTLKD